jgi:hypothetical protein
LEAGLGVLEFWALTPRETQAAIRAAAAREQRAHEARGWIVWHQAALQRVKRLPAYRQFVQRRPPPVTPAELARRRQEHAELARSMQHE